MELKYIFLVVIILSANIIYSFSNIEPTYEFREVESLRCVNINAIGCTTVLPYNHFLIEYIPDSQRCNKSFCITKEQTIEHELNHTKQYLEYGKMWEWE